MPQEMVIPKEINRNDINEIETLGNLEETKRGPRIIIMPDLEEELLPTSHVAKWSMNL